MCVSALPPMLDELDDELDLGGAMWKVKRLAERSGPRPRVVALDRPHHSLGPHHSRPEQNAAAPAPRHRGRWAWLSWLALLNGLAALICGAVLLGWSVVDNRPELWDLGMPIALGGQAGLLLGLVLQLERIWLGSREAADKLADVEQQLQSVHHATDLLSTTHSAPGTSFYAHLAEGASPNVLLADLKGQLDLVASRMVRR